MSQPAGDAVLAIDHVQIAVPPDGEPACRAFYLGVLGLREIERPAKGAGRSFLWAAVGGQQLHFRPDPAFHPAQFAHPGFLVRDLAALAARLERAGHATSSEQAVGPGRFHVRDPFGNRLEFLSAGSGPGQDDPYSGRSG
jgi:catechol 2,3-dioxygenase-like lactoylglutathione lyase family enzyme